MENYKLEDPSARKVLQTHLDRGAVSLCWDLAKNHGDREIESFFWRNLNHIRQVHLHDLRDGKSHQVVGTGSIDFMRFLPRLSQADLLDYCFEVRPRAKAVESMANLKAKVGVGL